MTTPRIEEMVEEFDKEFFHYKESEFGGRYSDTPTAGIFCGCYEGDLDKRLEEARPKALAFIEEALTEAYQAGVRDAVEFVLKEYGYMNDGCGCCMEERLDKVLTTKETLSTLIEKNV